MDQTLPAFTIENEELTARLELLRIEFLDLFTRHKDMVENQSVILTSIYLEKLGRLQLELLQKQSEAARLKMKMNLIQAAINRDESPDLTAIDLFVNSQMQNYYAQIEAQAAALDEATVVLSNLLTEEETRKLKELFRVLCKRLHPDLNPNQTEEEKDLFITVKAAYELQRISDLQNILLFLEDSRNEKPTLITANEKQGRINHLEKNIIDLKDKIEQLKQNFPFNIEDLIFDGDYIEQKQTEIKTLITKVSEEITKYKNIIAIMTDE